MFCTSTLRHALRYAALFAHARSGCNFAGRALRRHGLARHFIAPYRSRWTIHVVAVRARQRRDLYQHAFGSAAPFAKTLHRARTCCTAYRASRRAGVAQRFTSLTYTALWHFVVRSVSVAWVGVGRHRLDVDAASLFDVGTRAVCRTRLAPRLAFTRLMAGVHRGYRIGHRLNRLAFW